MNAPPPPGWYPDQADQRYVRWWDGRQWTPHVQPAQPPQPPVQPAPAPPAHVQPVQAPPAQVQPQQGPQNQPWVQPQQAPGQPQAFPQQPGFPPQQPGQNPGDASNIELALGGTGDSASVQNQVQQRAGVGGPVAGGGGTLFTEPVLVVNQKAKLFEMANEYAVYDQHGRQLGSVMQTNQSQGQKVLRMFTKLDSMMTIRLEIRDNAGNPQLLLTRPATMWKSTVHVQRPDQSPLGIIRMENAWGRVRFAFEVNGQRVGGMRAENLRAWDLQLVDEQEFEIGRISKTWQGLAKAVFSTADNYVLRINRPLQDPLLSMVVASALTVDTTLSQMES